MTSFDFEKILADAGAELDKERRDRLSKAMNAAIDTVEAEAKARAERAVEAVIEEQREGLATLKADIIKTQQTAAAAMTEANQARAALTGKIEVNEREASEQLMEKLSHLEQRVNGLKASRVLAELAWNDLPKKITIGGAVFVGLVIGAALTVMTAASERRQVSFQAAFMQQQVDEMNASIAHWEDVAGFKLGDHRGKRVFILDDGYAFDDYVPPIGAMDARNLWQVVEN